MPMTKNAGHIRRRQKRDAQLKKAKAQTLEQCQQHWQALLQKYPNPSADDVLMLYARIDDKLHQIISYQYITYALRQRYGFFSKINTQRRKHNLDEIPIPPLPIRVRRDKNVNTIERFRLLTNAERIVCHAQTLWQAPEPPNLGQSIAGLWFCLWVYGGYESEAILKAVYEALCERRPYDRIGNRSLANKHCDMVLWHIWTQSDNYGVLQDDSCFIYRHVVLDDFSLLWLLHIETLLKQNPTQTFPKYQTCVSELLKLFGVPKLNRLHKETFTLYRQTVSRLDEMMNGLLSQRQRSTAISQTSWHNFFYPPEFKDAIKEHLYSSLDIESNNTQANNKLDIKTDFVQQLKARLSPHQGKERTLAFKEKLLDEIAIHELPQNYQALVYWAKDILAKNAIQTAIRYLGEIAHEFIANTHDVMLDTWTADDFKLCYQAILDLKQSNKPAYTITVIKSLHQSLQTHYHAPYVAITTEQDKKIIKAAMIAPCVYHRLLSAISQQNIPNNNKTALMCIIMLLYRTGMRINEILGLRVSDVEYDKSGNHFNLLVRPNSYRSLKSGSGIRRLCVHRLLKKEELDTLRTWFKKRQELKQSLLFGFANAKPIKENDVLNVIKSILGNHYKLTPHSFRHHAISVMALILGTKIIPKNNLNDTPHNISINQTYSPILEYFTDYTPDEIGYIQAHFLGTQRHQAPSTLLWDALMEFVGHGSLTPTFETYIHTADIIAAHQKQQYSHLAPIGLVLMLSHLQKRSFNEHHAGAYDPKTQTVNLQKIRSLLIGKLAHARRLPAVKQQIADTSNQVKNRTLNIPIQQANTKHLTDISLPSIFSFDARKALHQMLIQLDMGMSFSEACPDNVDYDTAHLVYKNAKHFGLKFQTPSSDIQHRSFRFMPFRLTPSEQVLISECFEIMSACYHDKQQDISFFMTEVYQRSIRSKSTLRFKLGQKEILYQILSIGMMLFKNSTWQVNIYVNPDNKRLIGNGKTAHQLQLNLTDELKSTFSHRARHSLKITHQQSYQGYELSLELPYRPKQRNINLLKYICYLMIIGGVVNSPKI